MTKDEALDLALEALSSIDIYLSDTLTGRVKPEPATYKQWLVDGIKEARNRSRDAITAIKQARSAPVQPVQEPVAIDADMCNVLHGALVRSGKVISPPAAQRQWVGLPFGEICEAEVIATDEHNNFSLLTFARAIEAKLKERNT
jgi:hypothetical protein